MAGLAESERIINHLKTELKRVERELAVHENYNNPSSKATLFAKKRSFGKRPTRTRAGWI